jgi:hypothetical protein
MDAAVAFKHGVDPGHKELWRKVGDDGVRQAA